MPNIETQPIAIFEDDIKNDGDVISVSGFVGPEEGYKVAARTINGDKTGVFKIEYTHYADFSIQIKGGRLSYWRIDFLPNGAMSIYGPTTLGQRKVEIEGMTATGLLRVGQIVNAVMSLAAEYCEQTLENQRN